MAQINKGTTYSTTNSTVTVDNLNAHVADATLLPGAIGDQVAVLTVATPASDQVLLLASGQLKKATVVQALGGVTPSELLNRNNNLSDLASISTAKVNLSLNNVENKSSETIRSEITASNVTTALTYTPVTPTELSVGLAGRIATSQLGALNGVATLGSDGKLTSNQIAALTTASQLALIGTSALPVIGAQPLLSSTSTGTGSVVLSSSPTISSPTLTAPILGTPASGNLSNCTNVNLGSVTGTLAVSSGGTGVTTSTGTGSVVLSTSPTLITPALGTPASGDLSNCTNIPLSAATGTLATTLGGTGQTTYSNGQLLIGNSSGSLTPATLTAGSNVSITNASGSVTVASSVPAATTSQLGGIIPGSGFTVSSGILNAILPKAFASFSGQFADTTQVTGSYTKVGSTVTITYSLSGGAPQFYLSNQAYFVFTKASGAGTVPTNGRYSIGSVSTSGSNHTVTVTSAVAGDSAGSITFRYCRINSSENIGSIIYFGTVASSGGYIANTSVLFIDPKFAVSVNPCSLATFSSTSNLSSWGVLYDWVASSNPCQRTISSAGFGGYDILASAGAEDLGYAASVLFYGQLI